MGEKQVCILALAISKETLHDFDAYRAPVEHVEERFAVANYGLTMKCKNFAG
jgi:hypothetical protein